MPGEGLELTIRDGEADLGLGVPTPGVELSCKTPGQLKGARDEVKAKSSMSSARDVRESGTSISHNESISKRIKYRWSRLWLGLLIFFQLAVMVVGVLSLIFTIKKGRKTWETQAQIAVIFWPMSAVFFLVIAIANPLKKGVKFEVLSSATQTITFIATYMREMILRMVDEEHPNRNWISPFLKVSIFGTASAIMTHFILQKRRRLKGESEDSLGRKETRKLITHIIPVTLGSVMVSILYVASESMGCVMRRKEENIECWDVTSSNYSFSLIFVTFFFMSTYAVPFTQSRVTKSSNSEMTIENIYMFRLPPKEQLGVIFFIFAMFTGLLLFATSDEKVELHELDEKSKLYSFFYANRKVRAKVAEGRGGPYYILDLVLVPVLVAGIPQYTRLQTKLAEALQRDTQFFHLSHLHISGIIDLHPEQKTQGWSEKVADVDEVEDEVRC